MPEEVRLYNTLSDRVEPLETIEPGVVRYYVCGVSVSGPPHVGHGRSYVIFDTLRRVLEHAGYEVRHVQNFTDIEESIKKRAEAQGKTPEAYAAEMTAAYFAAMDRLGVLRAHHYPRVTDYIDQLIEATRKLQETECAYPIEDGVAFQLHDAITFGELLGHEPEEAVVHRVPESEWHGRKDPFDFIVWRNDDSMGRTWTAPWGEGRPGWHTECAVMATDILGPTIDLHGGGHDLIFPHHECERAIARCLTGEDFCHHWVHNGLVTMGARKMSKSLQNIVQLADGIDEHGASCVRALYLLYPYRETMEWRNRTLDRAHAFVERLAKVLPGAPGGEPEGALAELRAGMVEALRDDLDTPRAMGILEAVAEEHGRSGGAATVLREGLFLLGLLDLEPFDKLSGEAP